MRCSLRSFKAASLALVAGSPAAAMDPRVDGDPLPTPAGEWTPFALSDMPVAHDPNFNGGSHFGDAFGGSFDNY